MDFITPNQKVRFTIPCEWWIESGMTEFDRVSTAYPTSYLAEIKIITILEIMPPQRFKGVELFKKERMVNILQGFVNCHPIPPIIIHKFPAQNDFIYEVRNGVHRFYASIAAGFTSIPAIIVEYFDINS